ncbi:hypothetical protein OVY01_08295 [Robbsia sp. Bb-Pol-6]|uniref:Uncharacterized protein n=1 Tax=Robbsia betulipollinis TaxID=2981849 RepID=A0ABT3ZLE5_9BURK|nr:hypothetical protein [Robbsia betulipollinis]MCY0387232.1 hypothetical protein [Robbsia betulipollinis]
MGIIVVSDTYFSADQLRGIFERVSPELNDLVDLIFCSSAYRIKKERWLWNCVVAELCAKPDTIVHLGDNAVADVMVPSRLGIRCLHLDRYAGAAEATLQRREFATRLMFSGVGETKPIWTLYDGLACQGQAGQSSWDEELGRNFLGPVIFAFAKMLDDEWGVPAIVRSHDRAPRAAGSTVRLGFLMRDAGLLQKAAEIVSPGQPHPILHISRLTAFSASFYDDDAILHFIKLTALEYRLSSGQCAACLLLTDDETAALTAAFAARRQDPHAVANFFTRETLEAIKARSTDFRRRLIAHVVAQTGVRRGDTLCLVDTGFNGTIQYLLRDVMRREWDVAVIGRYLIYRDNLHLMGLAAGLIDASWLDMGLVNTLAKSVVYLETLCSSGGGSVIDYDASGSPVCKTEIVHRPAWVESSQRAALTFVDQVCAASRATMPMLTPTRLREAALTNLAAILFFPSERELSAISEMQSDVNIGGSYNQDLCDLSTCIDGLRRRGLLNLTSKEGSQSNHSLNLRHAGLDQLALYMVCLRNGLPLNAPEFSFRRLDLPVTFAFGGAPVRRCISAYATYDGYYTAVVPLGQGTVRVEIGALAGWLQIESITRFPVDVLGPLREMSGSPVPFQTTQYQIDGVTRHENGLLECRREAGITFTAIGEGASDHIRLAFRPVVLRDGAAGLDRGATPSAAASHEAVVDAKLAQVESVLKADVCPRSL